MNSKITTLCCYQFFSIVQFLCPWHCSSLSRKADTSLETDKWTRNEKLSPTCQKDALQSEAVWHLSYLKYSGYVREVSWGQPLALGGQPAYNSHHLLRLFLLCYPGLSWMIFSISCWFFPDSCSKLCIQLVAMALYTGHHTRDLD